MAEPRGSGFSLRRRLAVVFAIAAVVAVAALSLAGWAFVRQLDARHRVVERIDPALVQAQDLLAAYVDEETGVRGFTLSNQVAFLQPYTSGLSQARAARAELDSLLAHEPSLALVHTAEQRADGWSADFARPAIVAVTAGQGVEYSNPQALLREKEQFDGVRAAFAQVTKDLDQARTTSISRLNHADAVFVATLAAGALVLLIAAVGAFTAMRQWVTLPLTALGDDVRRVTDGDLQHPISPSGPPELAGVGVDAEAMRRRILAELEAVEEARARLVSSNEDLAQANDDLARSNVELEQFAYVASHDLQEPLRKVASFCQLLQRRYEGQLDERAQEYIAFAVDGANRMQTLINDLLAFSRVGRTSDTFVPVDLNAIVRQVLRTLDTGITEAGATITTDPLPTVSGDPTLLAALFQNLVGNSVKFHGEQLPEAHIGCRADEGRWLFDIRDNGIGIEPRFAERVFVIFQRLHTKEAYQGTGIGLALCKKIVEFHNGEIWIDTEVSQGTRICWTFPMVGSPIEAPTEGVSAEVAPTEGAPTTVTDERTP